MYHHHQQQQQQQQPPPQGPQGFNTGPRPQTQPPVRPTGDMMPPVGGFQFPRPTQLPDELESALSIRGSRDMDHRLIEHLNRLKQHQSQASGQHGNYNTNLCDNQPKQSVDWSNYEAPTKLFSQHPGQHQGGHSGTGLPNWNPAMGDSSVPPPPRAEGGRGFYTPESAGTILASFGLSNEDLEALSHYPDDQLTPDTLPFILRDLQIHKKPKASRSPEVPSLLTVTQTEGRVIDYGHASQAKDDNGPPKAFKKDPISSERTVKMYPTPAPKLDAGVGRQVRLEPVEPIKHGDRDYRRRSSEHQTSRSPPRDFSAASKTRHQDRDYRLEQPKLRASAEKRSAERSVPKPHPPPTVKAPRAGLKAPSKKLPTPTMMSDFSGVPPKVYPHTCSLCDMQCDQEQEWIGHLGTVNHTAACRHLRTKFPDWKPKVPSRDYGKRPSASGRTSSRSSSWSPPPHPEKHRGPSYKARGKAYSSQHTSRHHPYHTKDVDARFERPHSRGGSNLRRASFRDYLEKKELAGGSRSFLKRSHLDKRYSNLKGDVTKKTSLNKAKSGPKPGQGSSKQGEEGPPAKKKKVPAPVVAQGPDCLVYLTEIPKEATEQEVINLAGSFGPINNVLLMPSPEDDGGRGQQASVCMMKAEDAQTFANAPNLLIRDRVITATVATCPEEQSSDADGSARAEGGSADHSSPKKKGVVIVEDLPDSGWTEEHLTALAEPFGYPDDIIMAKQIGKAILIMPDVETAQEMVKVHSFSAASVNEQKVTLKILYRNIGIHSPVALYNLLMHGVHGAAKTQAVAWSMLVVVSNVPQTQSSAAIVHKLVSRIGTVFNTLAVNNTVICEMATAPLAVAVYRHYLKFPCMIQNNPLVFSRKPDPKTPVKVIPAFLDTEKNVSEDKETSTPAELVPPETTANPEPEVQPVEIKTEETDVTEVMTVEETLLPPTTPIVLKEELEEPSTEEAVKVEVDEVKVTEEAAEKSQSGEANPTENGEQKQSVEETKSAAANEGETESQDTPTEANVSKAASTEGEPPAKASKPSAPSGKKQTAREKTRDPVKNSHHNSNSSREEERRRAERERREKESRDRERRERERGRKDRDHDDRSKRDYDRERRGDPRREEGRREDSKREDSKREDSKREEMKRAWRREWERREGRRKPYAEEEHRRSDGGRRSYHRDREDRHKSSSERRTDEADFPFNLSDFVTVDEVGDTEAPNPDEPTETETRPEPGTEALTDPGLELGSEPGPETQTEETELTHAVPQETEEKVQDVSMGEVSTEEKIDAETEEKPQETTTEETHDPAVTDVEMGDEEQPAEGAVGEITEELCPNAGEEKSETNREKAPTENTTEVTATMMEGKVEVATTETSQREEEEEKQENDTSSALPAEPEFSENGEKDAIENTKDKTLAPFDPNCSVGLEYLVPMTGFFCKVCTRFFTGARDAQISHSKTYKHYENLQKFLKSSEEPGST